MVYRLAAPGHSEQCVIKLFEDYFPYHEICGNVIATKLAETAGPFFVKVRDHRIRIFHLPTLLMIRLVAVLNDTYYTNYSLCVPSYCHQYFACSHLLCYHNSYRYYQVVHIT